MTTRSMWLSDATEEVTLLKFDMAPPSLRLPKPLSAKIAGIDRFREMVEFDLLASTQIGDGPHFKFPLSVEVEVFPLGLSHR